VLAEELTQRRPGRRRRAGRRDGGGGGGRSRPERGGQRVTPGAEDAPDRGQPVLREGAGRADRGQLLDNESGPGRRLPEQLGVAGRGAPSRQPGRGGRGVGAGPALGDPQRRVHRRVEPVGGNGLAARPLRPLLAHLSGP